MQYTQCDNILTNIRQYYSNLEMVCVTIFCCAQTVIQLADTVSVYFTVTSSSLSLKKKSGYKNISNITNGENKSDVSVNLPEMC